MRDATVIRLYSDYVDVVPDRPSTETGPPRVMTARLRGRLAQRVTGEKNPLAVGDRVAIDVQGDEAIVEDIHQRRSRISRRHPHHRHLEQVIAANVDQVLVVVSAELPPFRPDIVDLYLVLASASGLPAIIVISKCDLASEARIDHIASRYRKIKMPILRTRVDEPAGVERLRRDILAGKVTVMLGQSGAGKSTLRNMLLGDALGRAPTAPVSEKSGEGRHVTTAATFEPLLPSGFLVDTPGIRDLSPWGVEAHEVFRHFPEFADAECRFNDCRHRSEPGCEVKARVERGEASNDRLQSMFAITEALGG